MRSRVMWLALAAVGAALSFHALESNGTASPPVRAGQVSLTVTSGAGSAALGDAVKQVQWVGTYQPAEVDAATEYAQEIKFDASRSYIRGSVTAPPAFKREWLFSNAWTMTEPADAALIGGVRVSHKPVPVPPIGGAANFAGGGDGFAVSRYKGRLYIVNHHWNGNSLKCVDPTGSGNQACPGMAGGVHVPVQAGQPFTTSGNEYTTSHRSYQLVYKGKMYFPVSGVNGNLGGILCADLDANKSCGFTPMSQNSSRDIDILGLGHWNNKLYAAIPGHQISCFDATTGKLCWPSPRPINGANANYERVSPFIYDGYMMAVVQTGPMGSGSPTGMWCFNLRSGQGCGGNWFVTGASGANIVPILNETGRLRGACFSNPGSCFDFNAQPIGHPANLPMNGTSNWGTYVTPGFYIERNSQGQVTHARTYIGDYSNGVDTIRCYDWTTGRNCGTASESNLLTYTITEDQELPGCMWVIGDTARGLPFDGMTMGRCSQRTITMTIDEKPADHYTFDPNIEREIKWSKVVINSAWRWGTDINSSDPEAVTVSIYDKDQSKPFSVRVIPSGKYSVDISDISYAAHPELTVVVRIQRPNGAGAPPSDAGAQVLWKGPPRQFSVRTYVGASDCSVDGTTKGITKLVGQSVPFDVQTASANTLVRGASPKGFGQLSIETGLFDLRDSKGRATAVRFSTTFNELTQSGDVVADQLLPDSTNTTVTPLRIASASALTLNPTERRISSALLSGPDAVSKVAYTWDVIGSGSYISDRMNTGPLLVKDNLGAQRLAYIRGDRSGEGKNGFRVRTLPAGAQHPLGMFVGSGVSLLPTKPMSGMSDFEAPGFGAFYNSAVRAKPVVFASGNDGMLHAYAVSANNSRSGLVMSEAFAHIPRRISLRLSNYVNRNSSQLTWDPFYLDATPMLADVDASTRDSKGGTGWRTTLIGAFGRAAPGLFALDVTQADKGTVRSLFEMWDSDDDPAIDVANRNPDMRHLGYIVSPPISSASYASYSGQVVKVKANNMAGYRWAYLTGNGYFSKSGRAALFIVYLDGAPGAKLEYQMILLPESAPGSGPNGLSTPRPVTATAKGVGQIVEAVYAGDLRGNLWKINISDPANATALNAGIKPLFSDPAGRSIVSAPVVTYQRQGRMINFATGDANITPLRYASQNGNHAAYGVLDAASGPAAPTSTIAASALVTHTVAGLDVNGQTYRTIKWSAVDLSKTKGWTFTLPEREAVVANPILHPAADEVIFTSVQAPGTATGACIPGGSWEYRIAPATGRISTLGFGLSNPAIAGAPAGSRSTGTTVSATGSVVHSGSRSPSALATPPNRGRIWWREVAQ